MQSDDVAGSVCESAPNERALRILVTGGAGYIGSHTCLVLLEAGHDVTVLDNLGNGSRQALDRVERLTGCPVRFVHGDVRDPHCLEEAVQGADAVVHFAALKAVGESCLQPLRYFDNNISGTISLLSAMQAAGVSRIVFSSSATVYGAPDVVPIREDAPLRVTNPYGRSKLVSEELIRDWCLATRTAGAVLLRYFNPVGAHPSGRLGEDPAGVPGNLMPFVSQVAVGRREHLEVFGSDYATRDGTGVRDYLHVMDLAEAHASAVEYALGLRGCEAINLGTGMGTSVLELVRAFEAASGRTVPIRMVGRRAGDVAEIFADPSRAAAALGWRATRNLQQMCADTWRWQSMNPAGYGAGDTDNSLTSG
jgi:UDP-glucose 4-epimerase